MALARTRLRELREAAGLSTHKMAEAIGEKRTTYMHWETRFKGERLPLEIGIKVRDVLQRHGIDTRDLLALVESGIDMAKVRPVAEGTATDLPVYSAAEGGNHGAMVLSGPVDWLARPEPLVWVKDAFAVYVVGSSMEPAYQEGDTLLIDPGRPPLPGNDIILETATLDGARLALLKRLVKRTSDHWVVRQYKPEKEVRLLRSEWGKAHVVVGKFNAR